MKDEAIMAAEFPPVEVNVSDVEAMFSGTELLELELTEREVVAQELGGAALELVPDAYDVSDDIWAAAEAMNEQIDADAAVIASAENIIDAEFDRVIDEAHAEAITMNEELDAAAAASSTQTAEDGAASGPDAAIESRSTAKEESSKAAKSDKEVQAGLAGEVNAALADAGMDTLPSNAIIYRDTKGFTATIGDQVKTIVIGGEKPIITSFTLGEDNTVSVDGEDLTLVADADRNNTKGLVELPPAFARITGYRWAAKEEAALAA